MPRYKIFALNALTTLILLLALMDGGTKPAGAAPYPAGFGRFGRFHDDGLLTLNIRPQGFSTPVLTEAPPLDFQFGSGKASTIAVQRIDPTEKILRLTGGGDDAPIVLHYTLLYPGFSARWGRSLRLRISGGAGAENAPRMVLERLASPRSSQTMCFLLRRTDRPSLPIALVFRSPRAGRIRPQLSTQGKYVDLVIKDQQALGDVLVVTPQGLRPLPPAPAPQSLAALRRDTLLWAGRSLPRRTRTEYTLLPGGKTVRFTEHFKPNASGEAIAPLPPLLAFARKTGYPVRFLGPITTTNCRTWQGDFAFARGSVVRYELPVPPTRERGYVRAAPNKADSAYRAYSARTKLLNELVGHLGGDWATNAVDLGYAGMTNAQMAWVYLTPARRTEVRAAWKRHLPLAFHLPPYKSGDAKKPWKRETEPFTRQSYLWTYFIDGPQNRRYDLDWGDALPLYGLYKYAQYSGDWAFVRQHWADVQRIYRYFDLGDDWAWMTVVNGDHGYSTGTGDPMAATFAGTVACLKMARALGDRDREAYFASKAARIAVPLIMRFPLTPWAERNGMLNPNRIALGFHETEGFTRVELGKVDPWHPTNVLSGDGVLPEVYAALLMPGSKMLRAYEDRHARFYPDWYKGGVKYPFETTYKGNSVYVTFPHIFARALLREPTTQLWRYVNAAQTNRNNAWIGPNVLAELLARDAPLQLMEWQPAAYEDGYTVNTAKSGRRVRLRFRVSRPTVWKMTAACAPSAVPKMVTLNGKPIPFVYKASTLTIQTAVSGRFEVGVAF